MSRRIRPLFLVATLGAALIAGCGGSSSSSNTSSTTTAAKASKTSSTSTTRSHSTTAGATPSSTTTPSVPANLGSLGTGAAAVYCQTVLSAAKNLTSAEKSQFKSYCSSLAHDSPSQLKGAEKKLCQAIVKDSVPSAYRAVAEAECNKL